MRNWIGSSSWYVRSRSATEVPLCALCGGFARSVRFAIGGQGLGSGGTGDWQVVAPATGEPCQVLLRRGRAAARHWVHEAPFAQSHHAAGLLSPPTTLGSPTISSARTSSSDSSKTRGLSCYQRG